MMIARVNSQTDIVINIEIAEEEWFVEQNAEHEKDSSKPYFVKINHDREAEIGFPYDKISKTFSRSDVSETEKNWIDWVESDFDAALNDS